MLYNIKQFQRGLTKISTLLLYWCAKMQIKGQQSRLICSNRRRSNRRGAAHKPSARLCASTNSTSLRTFQIWWFHVPMVRLRRPLICISIHSH